MEVKKFQKNVEDFTCAHCGASVSGSGYTNHCPGCLWSKHVDVNPGDRMEPCGGLMEPVRLEGSSPDYRIIHKCLKCGAEKKVSALSADSMDMLVQLAEKFALDS